MSSLIDHLDLTPEQARGKPRIRVFPGNGHLTVAATEWGLGEEKVFFHAGGPIVRTIKRGDGDIASEQINDQTLYPLLSSRFRWERPGQGGSFVPSNPDSNVVQNLLRGQDRPYLPLLSGIARQPYHRSDGTLVRSSGYDPTTGMFSAFDEKDYELGECTKEDAELALHELRWNLREFPFASKADEAAALSAFLTAACRQSLILAPAYNITATRSGSGKSYLAEIITLVAGPGEAHKITYPTSTDEARKILLSTLLTNPAVIQFDDMQSDWKSLGPLNTVLTSPTFTDRLLGMTRNATVSTKALFLGTGNGIEPVQDMRRRVVTIGLAPNDETPTLRTFKDNPVRRIRMNRSRFVRLALTIIEAYRKARQPLPLPAVPPIGSYDEWSSFCRYPLIWLGVADPATSLIEQTEHDPEQDLLGELLKVWSDQFGDDAMTVREIVSKAEFDRALTSVLEDLPVMDGRIVNPGKLGWYLKKNQGRRAGGLRIKAGPNSQRRTWRVVAD